MACRQETASDKIALWYPEPIAIDGGNAGIYRTLKTPGVEWKEKRNLGGLGGIATATTAIEHKRC